MWQDTTKLDYSLNEQEVVGRVVGGVSSHFSVCSTHNFLHSHRMIQFDRVVPTHTTSTYVCGNCDSQPVIVRASGNKPDSLPGLRQDCFYLTTAVR